MSATDASFVKPNRAAEDIDTFLHGLADAMKEEPNALVGYVQVALRLLGVAGSSWP